ncbi:MAG: DUF6714 family protein [Planctomycetota bacterium]
MSTPEGSWFLSSEEIAERSAALMERIHKAWKGVHLGRGMSIEDAEIELYSPEESVARRNKRKHNKKYMRQFSDWTAVDLESKDYEMPIGSPFALLDPEAFRYYMPVFLKSWLETGFPKLPHGSNTSFVRGVDDRLEWFMLCHDTDIEYVREQARLLSKEQSRCIAEFFALAIEAGVYPEDEDWKPVMQLWGQHLFRDHRDWIWSDFLI